MCRPLGVHTTFTSRNTLRKSLMKVKGRPGMLDVKGVVYSIPCADRPVTYRDQEDTEGPFGRTHEDVKEQGSSEWNYHACPEDCT